MSSNNKLKPSLSVSGAVALAFGIVVGAGLLSLPGMAYQQVGSAAFYGWLIDALVVIPLLVVFGYLGSRYPNAGGIAGFVRASHGDSAAHAVEVLLMGTFSLGIPAIASVGGQYLSYALSLGQTAAMVFSSAIIVACTAVNARGAALSSGLQQLVTYGLVICLAIVALTGLGFGLLHQDGRIGTGIASPASTLDAVPVLGLVFFAYTGWEMLSFTTEEFRNPRRDYPVTIGISFVFVVLLYLVLAAAIQLSLSPKGSTVADAPVAELTRQIIGPVGGRLVALLGFIAVLVNVNGALWAASRLVFSSARAGLLTQYLARVHTRGGHPANAVWATGLLFVAVQIVTYLTDADAGLLLRIAGQNFFLLYVFSVVAFTTIVSNRKARLAGLLGLACCSVFVWSFGPSLAYPFGLLAAGYLLSRFGSRWRVSP